MHIKLSKQFGQQVAAQQGMQSGPNAGPAGPPTLKEYQQPAPKVSPDDPKDMFAFANPLLGSK